MRGHFLYEGEQIERRLREHVRWGRMRPLEVLLYGWWPMIDERRHVRRILNAPVSIRYEPAEAALSTPRQP